MKTIYFDLGGVIVHDFISGAEKTFAETLHAPIAVVDKAYQETDVPAYCKNEMTDYERWKLFVHAAHFPESKIQTCIDEFYKTYRLFPETAAYIRELHKRNAFHLGILSDQPIGIAKYLREIYKNIFSLFAPRLTIISAELGISKKDPDLAIYHEAIQRAGGNPSEILFVDNGEKNIQNAASLGMQTFYFDITHTPLAALIASLDKEISTF